MFYWQLVVFYIATHFREAGRRETAGWGEKKRERDKERKAK